MKDRKAVLIVEDDEDFANSLGRSFARRDYEVKITNNTSEAITSLKKFHPTYAVVDLKMAKESGISCIKQLHEFDSLIKIVMLTGYASITSTIEAIKAGACYYLAKPANADDIIAAFLGKKSAEKISVSNRKTSIKNIEWEYINQVLLECDFNISKTARILGMHRRTLARKLEKKHISN
ncbi:MAG: response regulator transcription factor [Rickettsiales bacterium]|nr:response regulator transcription factor [Rickettsiales bacterium]